MSEKEKDQIVEFELEELEQKIAPSLVVSCGTCSGCSGCATSGCSGCVSCTSPN
jgi:hypothetical protein